MIQNYSNRQEYNVKGIVDNETEKVLKRESQITTTPAINHCTSLPETFPLSEFIIYYNRYTILRAYGDKKSLPDRHCPGGFFWYARHEY